jgi:hypothetical protein
VCGQSEGGELYCDSADSTGRFHVSRGAVSPSTTEECLPETGVFTFYQSGCPGLGVPVDRDDAAQHHGGPWLDVACNRCGPGRCMRDSFVDSCVAYAPDSNISLAMCRCDLLDPSCGLGTCAANGAYCEGPYCATPVCYASTSPISQAMCGGVPIDPNTCSPCTPHTLTLTAGVDDGFDLANGVESPSPSPGLMNFVNSVYGIPGTRNFDEAHANQYLAHTFTGLAPQNGSRICGARLRTRISNNHYNDSLGLHFVDEAGNQVGPTWADHLTNLGIPVGSTALITIDIGSLPGGSGFLTQMENGWLDVLIQDDAMIDFLELEVDYCCPCVPHTETAMAGVDDVFSTANGVESPSPSVGLMSFVNSVYGIPGTRNFDEVHQNQYFAHTFTGLEPENDEHICGARLRTRIEHHHYNDSLGLHFVDEAGNQVGPTWADHLTNLGVPLGGSAVITIDIGSLPGGAGFLAQMQNGWLDVLIQDDAMIDFVELQVDYCCPCAPYDTADTAGVNDNFSLANGPESPSPSADLMTYMVNTWNVPPPRNFDDTQYDHWFGHTFTGLAPENETDICDATLNTVVSNNGDNDATWLLFVDNSANLTGPLYVEYLSNLGVPASTTGPISINISSIPGGPGFLTQMENGWLDWVVQDDTAIDFGTLSVSYCCRDDGTRR